MPCLGDSGTMAGGPSREFQRREMDMAEIRLMATAIQYVSPQ